MKSPLPLIPAKRYFTIGEVSDLCGVKPYVLRYWEQEFTQLKPMKRRGNRRYYQHHEVLLIRKIRELLYEQGFTISGARNQLSESELRQWSEKTLSDSKDLQVASSLDGIDVLELSSDTATMRDFAGHELQVDQPHQQGLQHLSPQDSAWLKKELQAIRSLLRG